MGVNNKFMSKYEEAYKDLQSIRQPIEFVENSPYYHQEEWRPVLPIFVPDVLPDTYWISNHGRVYSALRSPSYPNGGIMSHSINAKGYHQINLQKTDKRKACVKIHRLVMLHFAFVPGCEKMEVDHLDGNKDNNTLWNLEWVSPAVNTYRAIINGQRNVSTYSDSYGPEFMPIEEVEKLFVRTCNIYYDLDENSEDSLEGLAAEYSTSVEYILKMCQGYYRPAIKNKYSEQLKYCIENNIPLQLI